MTVQLNTTQHNTTEDGFVLKSLISFVCHSIQIANYFPKQTRFQQKLSSFRLVVRSPIKTNNQTQQTIVFSHIYIYINCLRQVEENFKRKTTENSKTPKLASGIGIHIYILVFPFSITLLAMVPNVLVSFCVGHTLSHTLCNLFAN